MGQVASLRYEAPPPSKLKASSGLSLQLKGADIDAYGAIVRTMIRAKKKNTPWFLVR
jgi:hypothetical protein